MGRGDADVTDEMEAQALRAARYFDGFADSYSVEQVAAGRALIAQFGLVGEVPFDVFASDDYYQCCQFVLGLVTPQ